MSTRNGYIQDTQEYYPEPITQLIMHQNSSSVLVSSGSTKLVSLVCNNIKNNQDVSFYLYNKTSVNPETDVPNFHIYAGPRSNEIFHPSIPLHFDTGISIRAVKISRNELDYTETQNPSDNTVSSTISYYTYH